MADPFVDQQFTSGTTITSDWLNGINDTVLEHTGDITTIETDISDLTADMALLAADIVALGLEIDVVDLQLDTYVADQAALDASAPKVRTVNTIAELRALSPTNFKSVYVRGYYAAGDGGGGHYWYDSSDTTSTENGGTLIIGASSSRWKLQYFGIVSVKQFGAKGDGTTDDSGTLQAALTALNNTTLTDLYFPAGSYRTTTQLSIANKKFKLIGAGRQITKIQAEQLSGVSLFVSNTDYTQYGHIEGMTFTTNQINQVDALSITYGEADATNNRIQDRLTLRDLQFFGSVFGVVGHKRGILLTNVHAAILEDINIAGENYAVGMDAGIELNSSGTGAPSDFVLHNVKVYYAIVGLKGSGHLEGVNISQCFFIAVQKGVSISLSTTFPWFSMSQCHVNATQIGIHLENFPQSFISDNLIYLVNTSVFNPIGIALYNCSDTIVTNNNVVNPAIGTATAVIGIYTTNALRVKLANNKVAGYHFGYWIDGTSDLTRTFDNEASTPYAGAVGYNMTASGGGNVVRNTP